MPAPRAVRRFLVVTAVATPANAAAVLGGLALTSWSPVVSNLVAATVVTTPTYLACRRWVWAVEHRQRGRALAFWLSSMANVGASSMVVWVAARHGASDLVMSVLPFATYTVTWVLRFLLLDRFVFRRSAPPRQVEAESVVAAPTTA